jgi:hypothetical protein
MAILTESGYVSDWLKGETELPNKYSRDQITLANGGGSAVTYVSGTVLAKNGSGQFILLAPGASDGTQNVAGVLGPTSTVPAGSSITAWAVTRGNVIVSDVNITYPAGITTNQKNTAISQLAALGIIVRRSA